MWHRPASFRDNLKSFLSLRTECATLVFLSSDYLCMLSESFSQTYDIRRSDFAPHRGGSFEAFLVRTPIGQHVCGAGGGGLSSDCVRTETTWVLLSSDYFLCNHSGHTTHVTMGFSIGSHRPRLPPATSDYYYTGPDPEKENFGTTFSAVKSVEARPRQWSPPPLCSLPSSLPPSLSTLPRRSPPSLTALLTPAAGRRRTGEGVRQRASGRGQGAAKKEISEQK